ncbi:META domain-containing protein [Alteromonas sp. 14N.309.X.WAT.G.H12]|uniref:META domain-containing protein n=1 Tax=Alteromonas sp. 14N.309.X.WAT.G.H12 TaxID=3120824 RepID=UPI002FD280EF
MTIKRWSTTIAILFLTGCASQSENKALSPALEGQWQVEDISGQGVIDSSHITLNVTGNTLSGSTGCNNFTGTFMQAENTLATSKLAVTRKMCSPALMMQEQRYIEALNSATEITQSPDKPWLFLRTPNSSTYIKLVKITSNE